jgi:two-component system LytT family response regulator
MKSLFRTILIDDEEPARIRLKELLNDYTDTITIIGEAKNGDEAVSLINTLHPDLIFLDIQMPGKDGFEVIQSIEKVPYIIFCTAFDQYALKAFETNSIDYLVKPVGKERIAKSMIKLQSLGDKTDHSAVLHMVEEMMSTRKPEPLTSFPVKVGDKVVFIKLEEISFFEAKDKYVELHTFEGKQFILDQSLNYLEEKLPSFFLRVHRAIIINTCLIQEIRKYLGSKYCIYLKDKLLSRIISGRNYNDSLKMLMNV